MTAGLTAAQHVAKGHRSLASGAVLLAAGFAEEAGRAAYGAVFQAASALLLVQTGRRTKSHSGLRSALALLARNDKQVSPRIASFPGYAYEMKAFADYAQGHEATQEDVERVMLEATELVTEIEAVLRLR